MDILSLNEGAHRTRWEYYTVQPSTILQVDVTFAACVGGVFVLFSCRFISIQLGLFFSVIKKFMENHCMKKYSMHTGTTQVSNLSQTYRIGADHLSASLVEFSQNQMLESLFPPHFEHLPLYFLQTVKLLLM